MIPTNRLFTRREPDKDAKSIYIFCEGRKRESQYFQYFRGIDSRINIEVYQLRADEDNSPLGLYKIAQNCLVVSAENLSPKYEFLPGDEVWFVIDTDQWGEKIAELREKSQQHQSWHIAQSNPCFEVWLYYHFSGERVPLDWPDVCNDWKNLLPQIILGGFDAKKHPIYVKNAIENSKKFFLTDANAMPVVASTEVFKLAEVIYQVCRWKIERLLHRL